MHKPTNKTTVTIASNIVWMVIPLSQCSKEEAAYEYPFSPVGGLRGFQPRKSTSTHLAVQNPVTKDYYFTQYADAHMVAKDTGPNFKVIPAQFHDSKTEDYKKEKTSDTKLSFVPFQPGERVRVKFPEEDLRKLSGRCPYTQQYNGITPDMEELQGEVLRVKFIDNGQYRFNSPLGWLHSWLEAVPQEVQMTLEECAAIDWKVGDKIRLKKTSDMIAYFNTAHGTYYAGPKYHSQTPFTTLEKDLYNSLKDGQVMTIQKIDRVCGKIFRFLVEDSVYYLHPGWFEKV